MVPLLPHRLTAANSPCPDRMVKRRYLARMLTWCTSVCSRSPRFASSAAKQRRAGGEVGLGLFRRHACMHLTACPTVWRIRCVNLSALRGVATPHAPSRHAGRPLTAMPKPGAGLTDFKHLLKGIRSVSFALFY